MSRLLERGVVDLQNIYVTPEPARAARHADASVEHGTRQHLRDLDQVAYVRFASVYRQFEDVHDFVSELKAMLNDSRRKPSP